MIHSGDLLQKCKQLCKGSGLENPKLFASIIDFALNGLRPFEVMGIEEFTQKFQVSEAQVEAWARGQISPALLEQQKIAKWIIETQPKSYYGYREKHKWYLSPLGTHSEAMCYFESVLPLLGSGEEDDNWVCTRLSRNLSQAQAQIDKKQLIEDLQLEANTPPNTLKIKDEHYQIISVWKIVDSQYGSEFSIWSPVMCWPRPHPEVTTQPYPRIFQSRELAEAFCKSKAIESVGHSNIVLIRTEDSTVFRVAGTDEDEWEGFIGAIRRESFI